MDDTSRSLQARVAAILFFLHVQSRKIQEIPQSCKGLLSTIPLQRCLVYTGRMSSTFTIRDIVNEDATASVSDYGAHVLSWAPAGEQTVVWRPKAIHLKEGTAIRGGVPIIFPWFNSGFEGGHVASKKPKHGFARNSFWHYDKFFRCLVALYIGFQRDQRRYTFPVCFWTESSISCRLHH